MRSQGRIESLWHATTTLETADADDDSDRGADAVSAPEATTAGLATPDGAAGVGENVSGAGAAAADLAPTESEPFRSRVHANPFGLEVPSRGLPWTPQ